MTAPNPDIGNIAIETRGHVRLIGIDRPSKYNGFTPEMIRQLAEAYQSAEDDPEVFCICLLYTSPSPRDATLSRMPSSA